MPNPSSETFLSSELFLQSGGSSVADEPFEVPNAILNEEFAAGNWINYDTYDPADRATLQGNRHVDIRDFEIADRAAPLNVYDLSRLSMTDIQGDQVQSLDDPVHVLVAGEHWTGSSTPTNEILGTHNNWRVLKVPLTTASVDATSVTEPIDLLTGFADDDFVSLTLPSFPRDHVTLASSFLDLTSHPTGDFAAGPTASVALSTSLVPLVVGNSEFRVLRSNFNAIDLSSVTGARLRIVSTGTVTNRIPNPRAANNGVGWGGYAGGAAIVLTRGVADGPTDGPSTSADNSVASTVGPVQIMPTGGDTASGNVAPATLASTGWEPVTPGGSFSFSAWIKAQSGVTTVTNLIPNPSFEVDTSNWTTQVGTPTITRDTGTFREGIASAKIVTPGSIASEGIRSNSVSALPSIAYAGSIWVKGNAGGETLAVQLQERDASDLFIAATSVSVTATTGWQRITVSRTFGATGVKARLLVVVNGTAAVTYFIDGALIKSGADVPYFDGSMAGYAWNGTANASMSYSTTSPGEGFFYISAYFRTAIGDWVGVANTATLMSNPVLGTWYKLGATVTVPATATWASIYLIWSGVTPGHQASLRATGGIQNALSTIPAYFDGNWPGFTWTGTADNSTSTGPTLRAAALRLLSKSWKYGAVDTNTRRGTLRRGIAKNGDPALAPEYTHPIVWRSSEVSGENDPRPIDFNIAVGFNTGSRTGSNQISIYGRELTEDFMQQLDLNGLTQDALTGHVQPDVGAAMYNERVQTDLEPFKQEQLKGLTQFDLERTPDYLAASWIEFVLNWTATSTQLSVVNTEGDGYTFNLGVPLTANSNYVLVFELEDTSARAAIYPLGDRGEIQFNAPVFDSTQIDDDFSYKRRKGRFGWYTNLQDGDASIGSIRFRSASYAEYRSLPYESLTPVIGAELAAESSPAIDLFEWFVPTASSTVVEFDNELSSSGQSWRVTDYGPFAFQGIQSNPFPITDFDQTEVLLDVYYPSSGDLGATVEFYLKSQYDYLIPLPRPKIYPDQWQTVRLRTPSSHLAQTGDYRLVVIQNRPANLNWWIDNVRVFERAVSWHGRAFVEDPWAETEDDWTPFQNAFNRDYGGILFQGRERRLQVKGVGHKQGASITKVQFKPKYAELGRFVWPEDQLKNRIAPTAIYSTGNVGRLYTFNGFGSTDPDGMIVNWSWTISDGTSYTGPIIQHTFGAAGTYAVTLTVTDHNGLVNTTSANHSVA